MGSRARLAKSAGKVLGTAFVVGAAAGAVGAAVRSTTGKEWSGYATAGTLQTLTMLGLGLYYADEDPYYAGGAFTVGLGTALVTVLGTTAMAAGRETTQQQALRSAAAAGVMAPALPALPGHAPPTDAPTGALATIPTVEVTNLREVPHNRKRR